MRDMQAEIRENPTFLRYYEILQRNPSSVVFAPLAEMLILHNCYEEAITICKKGLEKNPKLISGRVAIARAYYGVSNFRRAVQEAEKVLESYPSHPDALEIVELGGKKLELKIEGGRAEAPSQQKASREFMPSRLDPTQDNRWNTVTMAQILANQGNIVMAKKIYNQILDKEPDNITAKEGIVQLGKMGEA